MNFLFPKRVSINEINVNPVIENVYLKKQIYAIIPIELHNKSYCLEDMYLTFV